MVRDRGDDGIDTIVIASSLPNKPSETNGTTRFVWDVLLSLESGLGYRIVVAVAAMQYVLRVLQRHRLDHVSSQFSCFVSYPLPDF